MGANYEWGYGGVRSDYQQAMNWYRKAADQGYADAQYKVGWFYENGSGVGKDNDQAKAWYQKAADQGNADAQTGLSRLGSVASVKISNASCSKIGDGAFRVEMSGDATAPSDTFLAVSANPYRPNARNTWNIGCGPWTDVASGWYHYCQRSTNQPSQTTWALTEVLYDQSNTQPYQASGHLIKGSPGRHIDPPVPFLASGVYRNLVCR
jgi:TPR repeat protein